MALKCLCQKSFLRSPDAVFKIFEIVLGLASWGFVYFGNVMSTSNDPPSVNDESLLASLVSLLCWLVTCASFVYFILSNPTKCSTRFDAILNASFACALTAATFVCASSHNFIWLCVSNIENMEVIISPFCDDPPNSSVLRNNGQNLALVIVMCIVATIYATHFIYVVTKLYTKQFIPYDHRNNGFSSINN